LLDQGNRAGPRPQFENVHWLCPQCSLSYELGMQDGTIQCVPLSRVRLSTIPETDLSRSPVTASGDLGEAKIAAA